jgi:tetratricopeptide (TPR) repeat protein
LNVTQQQHNNIELQATLQQKSQQQQQVIDGMMEGSIPSEAELVLLCLDYLRGLRRAYQNPEDMLAAEGLKADYITLAIYSLSRAFSSSTLSHPHNDPWMKSTMEEQMLIAKKVEHEACNIKYFPSMKQMTKEVLLTVDTTTTTSNHNHHKNSREEEKKQNDSPNDDASYDYDDSHASNAHRFYLLQGLSSGPTLAGPLSMVDLATAGLDGLQARSRISAEQDMIAHPLFAQFLQAVKSKGFFKDEEHETPKEDPKEELVRRVQQEQVYNERFAKVVSKFRSKLAAKAQLELGSIAAINSTEWQQSRRLQRIEEARYGRRLRGGAASEGRSTPTPADQVPLRVTKNSGAMPDSPMSIASATPNLPLCHPGDIEEAERTKSLGNSHMQKKEYQEAAAAYTKALKICPTGPNSHVYYSNRAAALLSMKKFNEAIADSERSLSLKPDYGKAHARLGLAHFLLGDYRQAMEAYTVALKYEPNNKGAQSYLEKAAKRVAASEPARPQSIDEGREGTNNDRQASSSFSVVSEWDRSDKLKRNITTITAETSTSSSFSVVGTIPEDGPQMPMETVSHQNARSGFV